MVRRQWGKLMLNVGLNQSVMVFEGNYGTVQKPGKPRDVMIGAMREVQQISRLEGYPITDEEFDAWVDMVGQSFPGGKAEHATGWGSAPQKRGGAFCREPSCALRSSMGLMSPPTAGCMTPSTTWKLHTDSGM